MTEPEWTRDEIRVLSLLGTIEALDGDVRGELRDKARKSMREANQRGDHPRQEFWLALAELLNSPRPTARLRVRLIEDSDQ